MERSAGEEVNGKPGDEVSVEERSAETSSERKKQREERGQRWSVVVAGGGGKARDMASSLWLLERGC